MQHELCFCAIYSPAVVFDGFLSSRPRAAWMTSRDFRICYSGSRPLVFAMHGCLRSFLHVSWGGGVQVWGTRWWMGIYGSPSAKPHKAWSNDPALLREIHNRAGHISKAEMHSIKEAQQNALVKVAEKSNGKRAYSGQKKGLQNSQLLAWYCKKHGCGCLFAWHACLSLVLDT